MPGGSGPHYRQPQRQQQSPEEQEREALRAKQIAADADKRAQADNNTQAGVAEAKKLGVAGSLPPGAAETGGKGQSAANQAEIARRLAPMAATHMPDRSFTPGAPMYSPLDTSKKDAPSSGEVRSVKPWGGGTTSDGTAAGDAASLARDKATFAPHDAAPVAPTPKAGPMYAGAGSAAPFRGSTADEIAEFNKGTDANRVASAAGTGVPVATQYGTASSRTAAPGEKLATAAPITDAKGNVTGVGRSGPPPVQGPNIAGPAGAPNWQQQVVNAHPEIGVKGSPQNLAFVAAHKAGQVQPGKELEFSHSLYASNAAGTPKTADGTTPAPETGTAGAAGSSGAATGAIAVNSPTTGGANTATAPASGGGTGATAPITSGASSAAQPLFAGAQAAINQARGAAYPTGQPAPTPQGGNSAVAQGAGGAATGGAPQSGDALDRAKTYAKLYDSHVGGMFRGFDNSPTASAGPTSATPAGPMYSPQATGSAGVDPTHMPSNAVQPGSALHMPDNTVPKKPDQLTGSM